MSFPSDVSRVYWVDSEVFIREVLNARSEGRSRRLELGKFDWRWTWGMKGERFG